MATILQIEDPPRWQVNAGDEGEYLLMDLAGVDSDNLDAVTKVEATVRAARSTGAPVTLAGSVEDSALKRVRIELGDDTGWLATVAEPGVTYLLAVQITTNTSKLTWPEGDKAQLHCRSAAG